MRPSTKKHMSFSMPWVIVALCLSAPPGFAADGGGVETPSNRGGASTTVNRQIVNMGCDALRNLAKDLQKRQKRVSADIGEYNLNMANWANSLRSFNEQTVALEASLASASDAQTKRTIKKELRKKARERRVAEKSVQLTQKALSDSKSELSAVENDQRITKNAMRQKRC